jgi:hypothetical protein
MGSIARERRGVNVKALFAAELANAQAAVVKQLAAAVEQVLGRSAYEWREQVAPWGEVKGICQRFSRNGRRVRCVMTLGGEVTLAMQRIVCECGGSVRLELDGWLRAYQRIGEDGDTQVRRWGALRLREMQRELVQLHLSPLALRTGSSN